MAIVDEIRIEEVAEHIFDTCVNPIANIMCSFLAIQVKHGYITKDEAKFAIASSVDVLSLAEMHPSAKELGGDMLMRMVKAIDALP